MSDANLTANATLLWLAKRMRIRTPLGAGEFLELGMEEFDEWIELSLRLHELYREIWPEHFANSFWPLFSNEREHEFYHLIHRYKFPMRLHLLQFAPNFAFQWIDVQSVQRHDFLLGFDCPFDELEPVYQIALALLNKHLQRSDWWDRLARRYEMPAQLKPVPSDGTYLGPLLEACGREPGPLRYLLYAILMVCYRTGNPWLDCHPHAALTPPIRCEWNRENIDSLARHWRVARRMITNVAGLNAWLEQNPRERMMRAVILWNGAMTREEI